MPLGQAHEHHKEKVEDNGGENSITESPKSFKREVVSVPGQAGQLTEFEKNSIVTESDADYQIHENLHINRHLETKSTHWAPLFCQRKTHSLIYHNI